MAPQPVRCPRPKSGTVRFPTHQSVIDHVVRALHRRGWTRAVDGDGHCRYRSRRGACALGLCIPNDFYSPQFEGKSGLSIWCDIRHLFGSDVTPTFVSDMQLVHDSALAPSNMANNMYKFVQTHHLKWPKSVPVPPLN